MALDAAFFRKQIKEAEAGMFGDSSQKFLQKFKRQLFCRQSFINADTRTTIA